MILIASDHAGFELKQHVIQYLQRKNLEYLDLGCNSPDSVDYPEYAFKLAKLIATKKYNIGILICGTGIGMSIAANRFSEVRAALCTSSIMAKKAREHNDANVLVLGARIIDEQIAIECLEAFLETEFSAGKHQKRVNKLKEIRNE